MNRKLDGAVWRARAALLIERLGVAAWPLVPILCAGAALIVSGLLGDMSVAVRFTALTVFVAGVGWALWTMARPKLPLRGEALRRIETASELTHRPASTVEDTLTPESNEPGSQAIWQAHRERELARLAHLKVGAPRSALKRLDPYALRVPAVLALIAAFALQRGDTLANLADAARFSAPVPTVETSLDAWLKPPSYTGKPPVLLTSPATVELIKRDGKVTVPEGSVLVVRAVNAKAPRLALHVPPAPGVEGLPPERGDIAIIEKAADATYQAETKILEPLLVRALNGSETLAEWRIEVIPDAAPKIDFAEDPVPEPMGALSVKWKASDDYGVARITAEFELADEQDGQVGIAGNGVFLYDPPQFPVTMKKPQAKQAEGTSVNDLTAHPWAGLTVKMTLEAHDVAGKTGKSDTRFFKLPERRFEKLLARALIEQRKALIANPDDTGQVQEMLDALLTYPQGLIEESGIHLAIRTVLSHLRNAQNQDEVKEAVDQLWEIAKLVDEGDLADARAELEAIRKELEKALAEGAPPERIAELTDKMRKAMDRYMEAMKNEMRKRMAQQPQGNQNQRREQMRMVTPEQLKEMMDRIENLAKNGANEAAQEMLSQLDQLLRNLQPGMEQQMGQQGNSEMGEMLDELSELMRRQQKLMDDTGRLPDEMQQGDPNESPEGQQGDDREFRPGDLGDQQDALSQMLGEIMKRLGEQGMQAPQSFGDAQRSMGEAGQALRKSEKGRALGEQGEAMQALREGAQGLAQQMMQQGMGNEGSPGRHGEARGDDRDPLGRPMPTNREFDEGPSRNVVPGDIAIRRAREILEMLRNRSNDPNRPRLERDYIDRLLRGLY
jgi:uncharacterized protein (TIGR02302 family)